MSFAILFNEYRKIFLSNDEVLFDLSLKSDDIHTLLQMEWPVL